MYKRIVIGAAALACLSPVLLQAQMGMGATNHVSYGVLLGAAVSTISDAKKAAAGELTAAVDTKRRKGFDGGIYVKIPLAGMFSLQPELHYAQKGVTLSDVDPSLGAATFDIKIDYAEVPVLLRMDLGSSSKIHPVLLAGASAALRISCKNVLAVSGAKVTVNCDESDTQSTSTDPFTKKDVSLVGGAGLSLNAAGRTLVLQLRYTQGLTSVVTKESDTNDVKPKNGTFALLLGIGF